MQLVILWRPFTPQVVIPVVDYVHLASVLYACSLYMVSVSFLTLDVVIIISKAL